MKTSPAVRPFQVVVDLDAATFVAQSILRGILRFARETGDWSVLVTHTGMVAAASPSFAFDGFIAGRDDSRRRFARALRGRKTVELRQDAASVARLAVEHFLARGFAHYAFVGHDQAPPGRRPASPHSAANWRLAGLRSRRIRGSLPESGTTSRSGFDTWPRGWRRGRARSPCSPPSTPGRGRSSTPATPQGSGFRRTSPSWASTTIR